MQERVLDHEEIEWQLEAVELAQVENWLKEHPSAAGVAIVPRPERAYRYLLRHGGLAFVPGRLRAARP